MKGLKIMRIDHVTEALKIGSEVLSKASETSQKISDLMKDVKKDEQLKESK